MTPAPGWKDTGSDYLSRRRARRGDSGGGERQLSPRRGTVRQRLRAGGAGPVPVRVILRGWMRRAGGAWRRAALL